MTTEFPYDVFLSHSAKDKAVVRPLAGRLRQDGLKVGFDEWELPIAASRQSAARSCDGPTGQLEDGGAWPRRRYAQKIEEGLEHPQFTLQPLAFSLQPLYGDPLNQERRFMPKLQPSAFSLQPSAFP